MVMGHIGFGEFFDRIIHAFHMPMFFFAAGFFYITIQEKKLYIKRKCRSLLIPYLLWGIVYYIIWLALSYPNVSFEPLRHILFENTDGMPNCGALWFLTALLICYLIYMIVDGIPMLLVKEAVLLCIALFGCYATRIMTFRMPWGFDAACVGVLFFHFGYVLRLYLDHHIVKKY